jgi:hypothetical protein
MELIKPKIGQKGIIEDLVDKTITDVVNTIEMNHGVMIFVDPRISPLRLTSVVAINLIGSIVKQEKFKKDEEFSKAFFKDLMKAIQQDETT